MARPLGVLSGADLVLEPGTLTSVVGSNGSGKSTLLRVAAGVSSVSGGFVDVPAKVGFVPERQAARGKFTGSQYLAHMGRIRGLGPLEARTDGANLLSRLGVKPGPNVQWDQLSKGNRQKVVIAQAFLGSPDVVVLDEPFSGLDDEARRTLVALIAETREQGAAVLSSHDVPPGDQQTYRIVKGRLVSAKSAPPSDAQLMRVELETNGAEASSEALTRRTEVLRWNLASNGAALTLEVLPGACDDVIRMALNVGWSVRSVSPIAGKGRN